MSEFRLIETIPVGNTLGECILWEGRSGSVWWTDIQESVLYRYALAPSVLRRYPLPERLCSFGFTEDDTRLICAFASGFALFDTERGGVEWLYRPERGYRAMRLNDGRVDRQGRFWSGSMAEGDALDDTGRPVTGSLYRISASAHRRVLGGIAISNSICFSVDGKTLYFADSPERTILAFEMDPATGDLGPGRVFASVGAPGVPDGSIIDAEGFLWNAEWGGARIARYSPFGDVHSVVELPVSQPTCICLGGENLDMLFVSTAREGLSAADLRGQPEAGNVLVYQTPYRGLPECRFRS